MIWHNRNVKSWVRVSGVARYNNRPPSTQQRLRDHYQATGIVQPRMAIDIKMATYVDCISTIFT